MVAVVHLVIRPTGAGPSVSGVNELAGKAELTCNITELLAVVLALGAGAASTVISEECVGCLMDKRPEKLGLVAEQAWVNGDIMGPAATGGPSVRCEVAQPSILLTGGEHG